jgi:hypothetical protein
VAKIRHFAMKKKSPKQHVQRNFVEKNSKKNHHILKKESYEITKIFVGFRQIFFLEVALFS